MSRYKVSRYVGLTPLVYDVTGPGNQVIARMWSSNEDEVAHLARFIEAYDEIVEALHAASDDSLCRRQSAATVTQIVTLLNRIDGEEAQ
jgi:hypothetical protein